MRPLAVAITLLTVAARPAATQDPYRVAWWDRWLAARVHPTGP
jgi:hypothetical protein